METIKQEVSYSALVLCGFVVLTLCFVDSPILLELVKQQEHQMRQQERQTDLLEKLVDKKKTSTKYGSSLNEECVQTFSAPMIPGHLIQKYDTDCHFLSVLSLVREYTFKMADLVGEGKTAEVENVQPVSLKLFRAIILIVLSEYGELLRFECKGTSLSDTKYSTILTPPGKVVTVRGETDTTMLYCQIPIGLWEDKILGKDGTTPKEIGQGLAEVKGMGERFHLHNGAQAPKFCGVFTTGLTWAVTYRTYEDGSVLFSRTVPITTWNKEAHVPDENGLIIVTSLLLSSLHSAKKLIEIIDDRLRKTTSVKDDKDDGDSDGGVGGDGGGGGGDGGGDSGDGGDRGSVGKALSNSFSKMSTRKATTSGVKKSNRNGGRKRTPLGPINMNSIITFENMAKHNFL